MDQFGPTTFTGKGVNAFQALAIASGLEMYARHKMQPNRHYTPKRMMQAAAQITGKTFKARAYSEAASALRAYAYQLRASGEQ